MIFVEINGQWNGQHIRDNASVTKLADALDDQQRQVAALAVQKVGADLPFEPDEDAADFARRAGFTQLDYHYWLDDTWRAVHILQGNPAESGSAVH